MKKRKLVEKIAEVGCIRMSFHYKLTCETCPLKSECNGSADISIQAAKDYLLTSPEKDKPCPHCGGSGEELTTVTTPGGSTAFTKRPCPLCLGSKKRIKRAELEAEVVRLRKERPSP